MQSKGRRIVVCFAVLGASLLVAPRADAADPANATPATAAVISQLPYLESGSYAYPVAVETSSAATLVANRCASGGPAYAMSWSKYKAPAATKLLAEVINGYDGYGHPGVAIVNANLTNVLSCGDAPVPDRLGSRTGAVNVARNATVYIARYVTAANPDDINAVYRLYVTSTNGVVPSNDERAAATAITTVPFSANFDTTMAARDVALDCDQFYDAPTKDVWWTFTPSTSGVYRTAVTSATSVFFPRIQVYDANGACLSGYGHGSVDLNLAAGVRYDIQVDAFQGHQWESLPTSGQGTVTVRKVDSSPPTWTKLPTTSVPLGSVLTTTASPCRAGVYNSTLPVAVDYTASDPQTGIGAYYVDDISVGTATRANATAYENDIDCGAGSAAKTFVAANGDGYRSTVANWSANRLAVVEDTNLTYTGSWSSISCACSSAGTTRRSTASGAAARFNVPATFVNDAGVPVNASAYSIALVMTQGSGRGKADIYVDNVKVATVDTLSTTTVNRAVVWRQSVTAGAHSIRVVNLATAGRTRIDVDAVVIVAK